LAKELKTHDGEKQTIQQILLGKLDIHVQKTETRSLSLNSNWIKDLTIKPETIGSSRKIY
jgi:hypothetical protein